MLHQIPTAPVCSKSGPFVGLAKVGFAHVDHLCHLLLSLKKHASHFKAIHHWLQETVFIATKICSFPTWVLRHPAPLKAYWLPPSARALSSCDIVLTEAYFHNILSGSSYLSTSRIPTPVIPTLRDLFPSHDTVCRQHVWKCHLWFLLMTRMKRRTLWEEFKSVHSFGGEHKSCAAFDSYDLNYRKSVIMFSILKFLYVKFLWFDLTGAEKTHPGAL